MARKATINMVAERAGVSRGTVDRVLNGRPHVKPEIYSQVVRAMRELNYVPPREAQAEALGLTREERTGCTLGVLLPEWSQGYFESEIMRGIEAAREQLRGSDTRIIIERTQSGLPEESCERLEALVKGGAEGIALCAKDHPRIAAKVKELAERGIPTVTFNSDIVGSGRLAFVGQDLVRGGRVAGELMLKLLRPGERVLAAVGNREFNAHRLRLDGFLTRLEEAGFPEDAVEVIETYNDYTRTYSKVREKLAAGEFQGIYMANGSVAGCIEGVHEAGAHPHIISHDLTDAARRLLRTQELDFVIAQNIYLQGYRPLILLSDYILRHAEPEEEEAAGIEILCAENIRD